MKKIVITGGPHAGKTTLLTRLEKLGFVYAKEAALEVINDLKNNLGLKKQRLWIDNNQPQFQNLVTQQQFKNENQLTTFKKLKIAFLDRGLHDGLGYMLFNQLKPTNDYLKIIGQTHYHKIFMLDLITPFNSRQETGRVLNEQDALEVATQIKEVYERFGYDVIRVPQLSVQERVEFILARILL